MLVAVVSSLLTALVIFSRLRVQKCPLRFVVTCFRSSETSAMNLRDYTFLGTTRSLCPHCRRLVDAKIIVRDGRVYFRKRCPEHGLIEDFVCSDVAYYDRHEFSQPARLPQAFGAALRQGLPLRLRPVPRTRAAHLHRPGRDHVQLQSANARCASPSPGPGGQHIDFATYQRMVDRYVQLEGVADVLQLSGGEPTLHPELLRMVRYAYEQPIQAVMINTNGIRLAHDPALVEQLAAMRDRLEIYLQFDGLEERTHAAAARRGTAANQAGRPGNAANGTTFAARSSARSITTPTCTRSARCCASAWSGRSSAASATSSPPTAAGTSIRATWSSGHHARPGQGPGRRRRTAWSPRAISIRCRAPIPTAT